jgi:hypothetical protein
MHVSADEDTETPKPVAQGSAIQLKRRSKLPTANERAFSKVCIWRQMADIKVSGVSRARRAKTSQDNPRVDSIYFIQAVWSEKFG